MYGEIRKRNKEAIVDNYNHLPYFIFTCRRDFIFADKEFPT